MRSPASKSSPRTTSALPFASNRKVSPERTEAASDTLAAALELVVVVAAATPTEACPTVVPSGTILLPDMFQVGSALSVGNQFFPLASGCLWVMLPVMLTPVESLSTRMTGMLISRVER